ncbi:hypothetical protein GCM10009716_11870 [Streptomyces sodiiphilus]|uniref:Uncharacterized protein n=1 Tax=Streptomyces sodiiphilus TaxID=226217 RepID=A0ABN2NVH1_9ACTN
MTGRPGLRPEPGGDLQAVEVDYAFTAEVPPEFVPLPDASSAEEWYEALSTLMPGAEEQQLHDAAEQMRRTLPAMSHADTIRTALCAGIENDSLSIGILTVSLQRSGHESALVAAEGIFRAKKKSFFTEDEELVEVDRENAKGVQGRQDLLLATRLPCGPGVTSISLRSMTFRGAPGEAPPPVLGVASLQLIVPAPREYCVYLTVATPTITHIDAYSARLARIGHTLSFDDSAAAGQDGGAAAQEQQA